MNPIPPLEVLLFVFAVVFSDAPTIVTGLANRAHCEAMRGSMEPELLKSGKLVGITQCEPMLLRRPPQS